MKGNPTSDSHLHAWYLKPLHWLFFIIWAAVLSGSKLLRDLGTKHKNRRPGQNSLK